MLGGGHSLIEKSAEPQAFPMGCFFTDMRREKTVFPQENGETGPQAGANGTSGPRRECGVGRGSPHFGRPEPIL